MKSFFKKLAFVMALAMVVTLAAPAAASAAEDVVIVPQTGEATPVESIIFTEGDEPQDFRFLNAPANWRETYKWSIVDPTVATVDQAGVVTPVKAGTTKLQFLLEGEVEAEALVIVNAPSTKDQFELTQISATQLKLTFTEDTNLDVTQDFQLKIVYENEADPADPIIIKWPVKEVKKDSNNAKVVYITPELPMTNGDHYQVVAGTYTDDVVIEIGKVDSLKLNVAGGSNKVYAETDKVITPAIFAGDIDLTSLKLDDYEIEYAVTITDTTKFTTDDFDFDVDDDTYAITVNLFEVGLELAIVATLKDDAGKTVATATTAIVCVEPEPWTFEAKVLDWALIHKSATAVNWNVKSVPADKSPEGEYSIVLKFKAGDKTYVTHAKAVQEGDGTGAAENQEIGVDGCPITAAGYEFYFYSTNPDVMLVDEETGAIGIYEPATVAFYVKLVYDDGENDIVEKYIYANEVEIDEVTKLNSLSIKDNKTSVSVVTKALEASFEQTASVTVNAHHQYNNGEWSKDMVTYTAYYLNAKGEKVWIPAADINGNVITFRGSQFAAANDSKEKVTIVGKSKDLLNPVEKTTTVTVEIVSPNYKDTNKTQIKLDTEERNRYETYNVVKIEEELKIDVKATATSAKATGYITLYKMSNKVEVGAYYEGDADGAFVAIQNAAQLADLTEEGSKYVVMKDLEGNIVPLTWTNGKLQYTLNTLTDVEGMTDDLLTYADKGDYTVEAVIVRYNKKNNNQADILVQEKVKVTNSYAEVKYNGVSKTTFSGKDCYVDGAIDEVAVVMDTFQFKQGNTAYSVTEDMIKEVKAVKLGKSIIIQYVVLNVPVGNGAFVETVVKPSSPVSLKTDGTEN